MRITVQLIKTDDGTHVWSQNYDRQLTDIFAIQEDIARRITTSLNMSLGLRADESLVNARQIDPETYQQYLRAVGLISTRGRTEVVQATTLLEELVARNPKYAPAWAYLTASYYFMANTSPERIAGPIEEFRRVAENYMSKMEVAARRAIELDPDLASANAALHIVAAERHDMLQAEELALKALTLDPNHPGVLQSHSTWLAAVGRVKEAVVMRRQLQALEPFVPVLNGITAYYLWVAGETAAAIPIMKALPPNESFRMADLAMMYASMGQFEEAAGILETIRPGGQVTAEMLTQAARLIRQAPNAPISAESSALGNGALGWTYLYSRDPARALDYYERGVQAGYSGIARLGLLWHPSYAPVRKTERFKKLVRDLGFVDYWRAKGWPEFCHPTTSDDFACE